jgi:hypothetical protein
MLAKFIKECGIDLSDSETPMVTNKASASWTLPKPTDRSDRRARIHLAIR